MMRFITVSLFLLALSPAGLPRDAEGATFDLGHVSGPATLPVGNTGLLGPVDDAFHFTIDPGASLLFKASVSTGFSNRFFILDMDGVLEKGGTTVVAGDAVTIFQPVGFPSRDVSFPLTLLTPGDYVLRVFGTAEGGFPGITASYQGSIQLAATPLPGSLLLMLSALFGLGWIWRRSTTATS